MKSTVLFLCPHNAAKSVLAAAFCQKLAIQEKLDLQITHAGTEPDKEVFPTVVQLLSSEGMDVSSLIPRHVTRDELVNADKIISLACDVQTLLPAGKEVEYWNDVPLASQDLIGARNVIYQKVENLIGRLKQES